MKTVRITCPKNNFILRQTKNSSGIWDDYLFTFENIDNPDYWIIINNYGLSEIQCNCKKSNLIYILQEPSDISTYNNDNHTVEFLDQFGKIITTQDAIIGSNVIHSQIAAPWFIDKSFDELIDLIPPFKNKPISIITSNKTYTKGHRKRIELSMRIKKHFGDAVDLYGRGFNYFNNKWDVLYPYKFHITIENSLERNYFTEKLIDPILSYTLPLYYGCSNIEDYFRLPDFLKIKNLDDYDSIKQKITFLLDNEYLYDTHLDFLYKSRIDILYEYQLFPMLVSLFNRIDQTDLIVRNVFYERKKESFLRVLKKVVIKNLFLKKINLFYKFNT